MSIKLRLEKGVISMQAVLADEAFAELLATIQKHESKESLPAPMPFVASTPPMSTLLGDAMADPMQSAKSWLAARSAADVLNIFKWDKNTDKILLLAAHHEAKGGAEGWKNSDMETKFSEARETFPGNFARDIVTAIKKEGYIAPVTQRTYKVSRTGWNRIADAITKLSTI